MKYENRMVKGFVFDEMLEFAINPDIIKKEFEEEIERGIKRSLIMKHYMKLQSDCKKILKLHYSGVPYTEIIVKMKFKTEGYARKRKSLCKGYLFKRIMDDKLYQNIER